jgi:hypothetical protein
MYSLFMAATHAGAPLTRHEYRPGHFVVVAGSLADLQGPVTGTVELPIWLFWHPDRAFDLDEAGMLAWVYQIVLREARDPVDLAYLNGQALTALWPDLYLPKAVRRAWEEQYPGLQAAAVPAA